MVNRFILLRTTSINGIEKASLLNKAASSSCVLRLHTTIIENSSSDVNEKRKNRSGYGRQQGYVDFGYHPACIYCSQRQCRITSIDLFFHLGIGRAICQHLLYKYDEVFVVLASRDKTRGIQAATQIEAELGGPVVDGRLEVVEMDTSNDESVSKAAEEIAARHPTIYGIVNNAGILGSDAEEAMNVNFWGPRRVNDALSGLLQRPGGRIVNIASASGPNFLSSLENKDLKNKLSKPWLIEGGATELDEMAKAVVDNDAGYFPYGMSKAFLNAYTKLHARQEPSLVINSVTPGFIASDMGKALGATKDVSHGAVPPVYCLMSEELDKVPTGRYYGSDCKRSPVDVYRGP